MDIWSILFLQSCERRNEEETLKSLKANGEKNNLIKGNKTLKGDFLLKLALTL